MKLYRPDIDGLRAVAVAGVLLFHAFPGAFPSGFLGVDVFFVISGYLISGILLRAILDERFSLKSFYVARIRRIFPSLLVVLAFAWAVGWFYLLPDELAQLGRHIAGGGAFVANLVYWREFGYFDEAAARKPLLHLWSLGVEEQFYIAFPLVLYAAYRLLRSVTSVAIVVAALCLLLAGLAHRGDAVAQFYSPLSRSWQLGAGILLSLWEVHAQRRSPNSATAATWRTVCSALGLVLIVGALVTTDKTWLASHPGFLPTIGAALVIAGGRLGWTNRVLLGSRLTVWIGQISYPVYLWHWPLFAFALILMGEHPGAVLGSILLLSSVVLGWATARWVEHPLRHGAGNWQVVWLLLSMIAMVFIGWLSYNQGGFPGRPLPKGQQATELDYGQHWKGWQDCDAIKTDPVLGGCKQIHPKLDIEVAVIGDSHAGHLASGLRHYYQTQPVGVAVMLHAGCFPYRPVSIAKQTFFNCPDAAILQALDHVEQDPKVKVVVLVGYAALALHGQRFHEAERFGPAELAVRLQAMDIGFRQTVDRLIKAGKKVVFVIGNPELLVDPKTCLERAYPFGKPACAINVTAEQTRRRNLELDTLVKRHKQDFPQVQFFSSRSIFCDTSVCQASDEDELWYATQDHLTPSGSRRVLAELGPLIETLRLGD